MQGEAKVLIIGLDGLAAGFLEKKASEGLLPNTKRLMDEGSWGVLRSTTPYYTPTAWTSIVTGVNPGKHGIFGFTSGSPQQGRSFSDAETCRSKTIWDLLTEKGIPSIVCNVPMTYPPRPIDGVLISGMGTPRSRTDYVLPEEERTKLFDLAPGYVPDVEVTESAAMSEREMRTITAAVRRSVVDRCNVFTSLLERREWRFAMLVLEAPDRLQHLYWRALNSGGPEGEDVLDIYREMDRRIADMIRTASGGGPLTTLVVSDHGFQSLDYLLFIDNHLKRCGLLTEAGGFNVGRISRNLPPSLRHLGGRILARLGSEKVAAAASVSFDADRTVAVGGHVFEQGVWVFRSGDPVEDESRIERTRKAILELKSPTGERAVSSVLRKEEVFSGPCVADAPDLFPIFSLDGVMMLGGTTHKSVWEDRTGDGRGIHHPDGVFIVHGPSVRKDSGSPADAHDVAPTALAALGLEVPADMDGDLLTAAGLQEAGRSDESLQRGATSGVGYSKEEEEQVAEQLRALGYLDG